MLGFLRMVGVGLAWPDEATVVRRIYDLYLQGDEKRPSYGVKVTGDDEPGMEVDCMAAGANRFLQKPLNDKTMLDAIDQAITDTRP